MLAFHHSTHSYSSLLAVSQLPTAKPPSDDKHLPPSWLERAREKDNKMRDLPESGKSAHVAGPHSATLKESAFLTLNLPA